MRRFHRFRSAITGRFVRRTTAELHPQTTVEVQTHPPEPATVRRLAQGEKGGRRLRLEAIAAAAEALADHADSLEHSDRELYMRNLVAVGLPELRRLRATLEGLESPWPSASDAGELAFGAYVSAMRGVTHDGRPIPSWGNLGDEVRLAWTAAAARARRA